MRRIIVVLAVATLVVPQMSSGAAYGQTDVPRRYVVVFKTAAKPGNAADVIRAAGGELTTSFPQVGIAIATSRNPAFQGLLRRHSAIVAVGPERSHALPNLTGLQVEAVESEALQLNQPPCVPPTPADDLYCSLQWNIRRVGADLAWAGETGSNNIVVAVIDNGVASNHPDLAPNLVFSACYSSPNFSCLPYPNILTLLPPLPPGTPVKAEGTHGTMVAGIIAAAFGNGRVVGVGPNLGIASYNVFEPAENGDEDEFEARDGSVWAAMLDAAAQGFRVINLSMGDYVIFSEKDDEGNPAAATWVAWNRVATAVVRSGVTIVASAGNDARDLNGNEAHIPSDLPQVISVSATGIRPTAVFPRAGFFDVRAFYANYGAAVDLAAPGGDCGPTPPCQGAFMIVSTAVRAGPTCAVTQDCLTTYFRGLVGTSFAAPHVAGVAGLMLSRNPDLQPHQVAAILTRTAEKLHDPKSDLSDRQEFGHGMVNALEAVNAP